MSDRLEEYKRRVLEFYDLMFNECQPAEAGERHVGASSMMFGGSNSHDRGDSGFPNYGHARFPLTT